MEIKLPYQKEEMTEKGQHAEEDRTPPGPGGTEKRPLWSQRQGFSRNEQADRGPERVLAYPTTHNAEI